MTSFRERNPVRMGLIGLVAMLLLGFLALNWERLPVVGGTVYQAEFAEAAGLKPDNEVRIGGVKVGTVTDVSLASDRVLVSFRVDDAWVGDKTTASIEIKTLLGQKTLALEPFGTEDLNPDEPIPLARTSSPYDVNDAFGELSRTLGAIDTDELAEAFGTLTETFDATTPENVKAAMSGLASLSKTISSRDEELAKLLGNTSEITTTLAEQRGNVDALLTDGRTLLSEINKRANAIGRLLDGTRSLARELDGVVRDNQRQLRPALQRLKHVATVLERNQDNLNESLRLAGPFYRLVGDAVSNGPWIDVYLCGLIIEAGDAPESCIPPKRTGGR
ncbi:MCE family protein [Haloechinothrix salitolerans]|uniref:MCE family protein n=1 Tax=Haloechinothrix salitolerans TaxID=926830 RepID=A0ABW2C643_9PSEU